MRNFIKVKVFFYITHVFAGVKVQSGRLNPVLRLRSINLIYLFDDNRDCSSFLWGQKKKQFKILFLYFLGKRNLEDFYRAEI